MRTTLTLWAALLLAGCGSADPYADLPAEPDFTPESGFELLHLDDFTVFEEKPAGSTSWRETGGRLECTGDPRGYLYSKDAPMNFTLRFDVRYPAGIPEGEDAKPPNTGVLLFITGEHRVWPKCLEVQGRYDELGQIKSNARDVTVAATDDPLARTAARKLADDWNSIEVVVRDGAVSSTLNGTPIATSEATELAQGPFGLQSEGNPVHFRYVRIRQD